jgi:hypothetical protein
MEEKETPGTDFQEIEVGLFKNFFPEFASSQQQDFLRIQKSKINK